MAMVGIAQPRVFDVRRNGTMLAPHFRASMSGPIDNRLPEGEQGLGVMTDDHHAKFYPLRSLGAGPVADDWLGRTLTITLGEVDGIPSARWADDGKAPMQLLTRWYGFAFTYPDCEIYS